MKILAAIIALFLTGCSFASKPEVKPVVVPPEPKASDKLIEVYQKEVIQDAAILKAVRPHISSGSAPALSLYDTATQGLISIGGEPSFADVDRFTSLILKPNQQELDRLRAEKVALDKRTNELEADVKRERDARIKAQADADAAKELARQAAIEARKAETVGALTKVGACAICVGVLALLFGSWLNISKLTAGLVIGAGMAVAAGAPWIVDLAELRWILAGLAGLLAVDLLIYVGAWTWRLIRHEEAQKP